MLWESSIYIYIYIVYLFNRCATVFCWKVMRDQLELLVHYQRSMGAVVQQALDQRDRALRDQQEVPYHK